MADLTRVYAVERDDVTTLRKMVALPALPGDWRTYFAERLAAADAR